MLRNRQGEAQRKPWNKGKHMRTVEEAIKQAEALGLTITPAIRREIERLVGIINAGAPILEEF